jgi:hypothetical protein
MRICLIVNLSALVRYRYKAATCGGKAVPSFVTITHTFAVQ